MYFAAVFLIKILTDLNHLVLSSKVGQGMPGTCISR